jgi:Tfp pilus assembly protein PilN
MGIKFLGLRCTALEAANELLATVNVSDALLIYPTEDIFQVIGLRNSSPHFLKVVSSREAATTEIERNLDNYGKSLYVTGGASALDFERFAPRTLPLNMPNVLSSISAGKRQFKTDFVPAEFSTPKKDYYPYALVILSVICVVIFFSTTVLAYLKDYRALNTVNDRISSLKEETREAVEVERKISAANDKFRFLSKFQYDKNTNIRVLVELSGLIPQTAWLSSLSVDEKGVVEIDGFANRAADIIQPLENSDLFKDVEFSSPVTVREGTERFSIKMQIETMEREDQ